MQRISINGIEAQHLSVMDRGLHYGDGLFETIAFRNGKLEFWSEHLKRMERGAEVLGITFPGENEFLQDVKNLVKPCPDENYAIKLLLTRGTGERGYHQAKQANVTRAVITSGLSVRARQTAKVCLCKHPVSINSVLAGIKHLNRLDNVLARREWDNEFDEGFMFDTHGNLIEGTMSNVFGIKNNVLYTPGLDQCGVNGIVREQVLMIAKEKGIKTNIKNMSIDDIGAMDEIFITNSIIGLWPVSCVGEVEYSVGDMTRNLEKEFKLRERTNAKTIA